jgi:hypothetical protein
MPRPMKSVAGCGSLAVRINHLKRYSALQDLIHAFAYAFDCLSVGGSIKHDPS